MAMIAYDDSIKKIKIKIQLNSTDSLFHPITSKLLGFISFYFSWESAVMFILSFCCRELFETLISTTDQKVYAHICTIYIFWQRQHLKRRLKFIRNITGFILV